MARTTAQAPRLGLGALALVFVQLSGCNDQRAGDPGLHKASPAVLSDVPIPAADGPKLGSVANVTFVVERPTHGARVVGYLHAGALVARANEPSGTEGCPGGWYAIRPRGFVCVGESATLDLSHPTLAVMAMRPKLDATLPYTYARARKDTIAYEVDTARDATVHKAGVIPSRSGAAIVGSWSASDEDGVRRRLALLSDGRFLDANDLEQAKPSDFRGVDLDDAKLAEPRKLPVAFVTKRGAKQWRLAGDRIEPDQSLPFHSELTLAGGSRSIEEDEFWELANDRWVKERESTVIRGRSELPNFVTPRTRWIDVSVLAGTAVLYEGAKPVYATLVSVGRDRLGDPTRSASTARGEFPIVYKHVTAAAVDPKGFANRVEIFDAPWALELSSGQWLYGAFWHDRFGVAHGLGNLELSPADAAFIWRWVSPELPEGWHGAAANPDDERTMVSIHE